MIIELLSMACECGCPYAERFHVGSGNMHWDISKAPFPLPYFLDEADDSPMFDVQYETGLHLSPSTWAFREVVWQSADASGLPFVEYGCPCTDAPHRARLFFQAKTDLDAEGIGLAPPLDLVSDDVVDAHDVMTTTLQSPSEMDGVAFSLSSHHGATQTRYLVLPGNYSGDSWACVAAMLLDEDLKVVLPMKGSIENVETDYDEKAKQFYDFATTTKGVTTGR